MKEILFILLLIICKVNFSQNLSDIQFGTDSTFDIVTWNIEHFPKNGNVTIDSVSKIIESVKADIIACQEIDDLLQLNAMLNNYPNYSAIYDPNNFEGLAYIYNTTTVQVIDDYSIYTNGNFWRPFPRAPYLLKVSFQNEVFILINNHLKCCGDGTLDPTNIDDEENRRHEANVLLESYIANSFLNSNVILLGDLNDELTDASVNNVFNPFYDHPDKYIFVDQLIANGSSSNWSYPSWPSHIDHILITDELFSSFNHPASEVLSIRIDDYLPNGFSDYDTDISDHRPVGLKLFIDSMVLHLSDHNVDQSFMAFPNPASTQISIKLSDKINSFIVEIHNTMGQLILVSHSPNSNLLQVDISEFSPGIYYVSTVDNNLNLITKKILVQ